MPNQASSSSKPESLDEILSHSAATLAEHIQAAAAWAKSEMDLQIEVAGALKDFAKRAQVNLEGHHNVTIATGRADSVYGSVIVEYKAPGTLSPAKESSANKALIDQLKKRFYDMRREEHRAWNSMFGVGTDGRYFIFLRFRDDKWTDQEPLPVDRYSTERFLWALYNLGQKGKPYQPEYLHGDFGAESEIAREGVRTLYEEILGTDNPRAQVFFNQWKILFGEVCGYDVENLSDKLKKLADFYVGKGKPQPAQLLFALHTYYAILIKLLAAEIVSFFNPWMTRQVEKLQSATTSAKLRRELEDLERGGVFHTLGITNFLEGDLFSWYLSLWSEPIEKLTRRMITRLDEYNPGTLSEDPAQSRDLLKKLYQQLFPKSVRHDLGEYYTPDWLAEHVLNELGYEGDPDKRLLDPACGSGTFLVMAINRIRRWYDANREKCAYDEGDLLKKILANVVGFDLNPLAVMAARTNYLVAIKDLIRRVDSVEIPVYLCDSIMTPAEYGTLFTGAELNVAKVPCSAMKPPHLLVPKEIANSPKEVAKYADVLETCVRNGYAPEEFLIRCKDEGLTITATPAHVRLYEELVRLDKENKNGIWARIIKNNFAPLFVGRVDYVAGNPPWVTWESLPADYRAETEPVWKKYKLYEHTGMKARLSAANDDISILMTYVSSDSYLRPAGKLGFVITQSVFQSVGGEGFRRFKTPTSELCVERVDDFVKVRPFEAAQNRTATFTVTKGRTTKYPVPYIVWERRGREKISEDMPFDLVRRRLAFKKKVAEPSDKNRRNSAWQIHEGISGFALRMRGASDYVARKGVCTSANSVYWVNCRCKVGSSCILIENLNNIGKKKTDKLSRPAEAELIFPVLRGRDVKRWDAAPSVHMVLPQVPETGKHAIPIEEMRKRFPRALDFLQHFEGLLRQRNEWRKLLEPVGEPFYALYAVGPYTFAPWKVVFKEIAASIQAAVVSTWSSELLGERLVIPDHKLILVAVPSEVEAHYLCGVLNSRPVNSAAMSYMVGTQISTHIFRTIAIPRFTRENPLHMSIAKSSIALHKAARQGDSGTVAAFEREIDRAGAELWGMREGELGATEEAAAETGKSKGRPAEDEEDV